MSERSISRIANMETTGMSNIFKAEDLLEILKHLKTKSRLPYHDHIKKVSNEPLDVNGEAEPSDPTGGGNA